MMMHSESYNGQAATADEQVSTSVARRNPLKWVLVLVCGVVLAVVCLAVLRHLFVRRIPELTPAALAEAEEKWKANGPASYDLALEIGGNRPGIVHVEVRSGVVTAMTRDGRTPPQRRTWNVWSVPGQFETIARELELADDPAGEMQLAPGTRLWLRCEFDPKFGYPRQFHRAVFGGGPEIYWKVTKFKPLGSGSE